ncbi:MAG: hypothetical protein Q9187_003506 [Circinaria calcarea]
MTSYFSYPPHIFHSSRPVAPSEALALLSAYLEATTTDASLRPNALLTESGPVSATSGSNMGLVLHNLKRVEAGLKGEHLGTDLSFAQFGGEGLPDLQVELNRNNSASVKGQDVDPDGQGADGEVGWQDKGEFEREQEITEGEIGERSQAVVQGSKEVLNVPRVEKALTTGDKAERKRRKHEKRKEQKQRDEQKDREKQSKE